MNKGGQKIIDGILDREGSRFTNHPNDRGGPTKYGITLGTLRRVRKDRNLIAADVAALTETEARQIYQSDYIDAPGFWRINSPQLQELLVDCGVNHGQSRPIRWLQSVVGASQDGVLGRNTATATNTRNPKHVFADVLSLRNSFFEDLDDKDQSQEKFQDGWVEHRVNHFIRMLGRWEEYDA